MSNKLPRIPARLVIRVLLQNGYYVHHQTGSHVHLRHDAEMGKRIVIPGGKKDIKPKTLKSILTQAGLSVNEFVDLL